MGEDSVLGPHFLIVKLMEIPIIDKRVKSLDRFYRRADCLTSLRDEEAMGIASLRLR